jgi:nucleotide-binding universal stress UspA family protein
MYKTMLVPLDGSELAEVVFVYAKELAGRLDLDVVLLHVYSPAESELLPKHRAYVERVAEIIRRQLEEVRKGTGILPGGKTVEVRGELAAGHPAYEILRYADETGIDLILMGTHGRSGVSRWAIGSVADKVLRASKVPVLLVRAGIPDEIVYDKWPRRTGLVPLDGSELAEVVLPHVEAVAKQRGVELVDVVLLAVCEPTVRQSDYPPEGIMNWDDHVAKVKQGCVQYLAGVEKQLKDAGLNVRSEVQMGDPANTIVEYANTHPFNLIVMSTHGRSGPSRWVFGSVAEKVLQGVSSPIFLVRPSQQ